MHADSVDLVSTSSTATDYGTSGVRNMLGNLLKMNSAIRAVEVDEFATS